MSEHRNHLAKVSVLLDVQVEADSPSSALEIVRKYSIGACFDKANHSEIVSVGVVVSDKPPPKKAYCSECGSYDVQFDAVAVWDTVRQDYFVVDLYEGMTCNSCHAPEAGVRWSETWVEGAEL